MSSLKRSQFGKIAAGIIAALMLTLFLLSAFYIANERNHHCSANDCPICATIQQCEKVLYRLGSDAGCVAAVMIPAAIILFAASIFTSNIIKETLVSNKIRLNN